MAQVRSDLIGQTISPFIPGGKSLEIRMAVDITDDYPSRERWGEKVLLLYAGPIIQIVNCFGNTDDGSRVNFHLDALDNLPPGKRSSFDCLARVLGFTADQFCALIKEHAPANDLVPA